jgi:hypothetical protein
LSYTKQKLTEQPDIANEIPSKKDKIHMPNPGYPECFTGGDSRAPLCRWQEGAKPPTRSTLPDPAPPTWLTSTHEFFHRPVAIRGISTGVPAVTSGNGGFLKP